MSGTIAGKDFRRKQVMKDVTVVVPDMSMNTVIGSAGAMNAITRTGTGNMIGNNVGKDVKRACRLCFIDNETKLSLFFRLLDGPNGPQWYASKEGMVLLTCIGSGSEKHWRTLKDKHKDDDFLDDEDFMVEDEVEKQVTEWWTMSYRLMKTFGTDNEGAAARCRYDFNEVL